MIADLLKGRRENSAEKVSLPGGDIVINAAKGDRRTIRSSVRTLCSRIGGSRLQRLRHSEARAYREDTGATKRLRLIRIRVTADDGTDQYAARQVAQE